MHSARFILPTAFVLAVAGCSMVPGLGNLTARSADNPLGGKPVSWSKAADGVPFEGQKACSVWPLEDELVVKATETEVCVDGKVHKLVDSKFDGPTDSSLTIESDGSGEEGLGAGQLDSVKAKPKKVGSCYDKSLNLEKNVWVAEYSSCVPNKTVSGKAALSTKSTYLQVGEARWKFPVQEAPKTAGTTAPKS